MGHSLPASDETRRVGFYTSSIGVCTACNPERGGEWGRNRENAKSICRRQNPRGEEDDGDVGRKKEKPIDGEREGQPGEGTQKAIRR
jgi:hypothetical protein